MEAIRKLRESLETLEKREIHISKRVELTLAEAKQKAAKKDKRGETATSPSRAMPHPVRSHPPPPNHVTGALFALKRKKLYEEEISKLQGARITLDSQISALESSVVNIETFNAMKGGAQALKAIRGNMCVGARPSSVVRSLLLLLLVFTPPLHAPRSDSDKVDEMMDEMQEEKDIHDQIADAIARPMGDPFDDVRVLVATVTTRAPSLTLILAHPHPPCR